MMKKITKTIIIILFFILYGIKVFAVNTHSIDLELDSSQYLTIADASQTGLDLNSGDLSLEAWISAETLGTNKIIMAKGEFSSSAGGYQLAVTSANKIQFDATSDGSTSDGAYILWQTDSAVITSANTWYHVAVTFNATTEVVTFYINGSSVAGSKLTGTTIGATIYNNTFQFIIGARNADASITLYFDGKIDEARVWNDLRTGTEISDNYQTELVGNEANLQGYWKLNNSLLDETANNNDLTNNNSATFSTNIPFPITPATPASIESDLILFE